MQNISSSPKGGGKGFISFIRKHSVSLFFIGGFLFDIFFLPEVDHFITIVLGTLYVTLFAICLLFRELLIKNNKVDDEEKETYRLLTFLISFTSGSSLSYIFSYSLRSADIDLAAPFLIVFFSVLISNELLPSHKFRLLFDYILLNVSSSLYLIYMFPLITGVFSDGTFFASILLAAVLMYLYTAIFSHYSEFGDIIKPKGNALSFSIPVVVVFLSLNFLLPPVPFKVERILVSSGAFHVESEKSFIAKILTINKDKSIHIPYHEGDTLSYTTIYYLPEGVISSPEHVWRKKTDTDEMSFVETISKKENTLYESRSLETRIKSEKGLYNVITKVGRRVVREETVIVE